MKTVKRFFGVLLVSIAKTLLDLCDLALKLEVPLFDQTALFLFVCLVCFVPHALLGLNTSFTSVAWTASWIIFGAMWVANLTEMRAMEKASVDP